jgi:hypothetical protein
MTLDVPAKKRRVGITFKGAEQGVIHLDAAEDVVSQLEQFGTLTPLYGDRKRLQVDSRYDFAEVLAYIEALNNG